MPGLDPYTLRLAAARLDSESDAQRHRCACALHEVLGNLCADLAAEFRTQAIRAEQAALTGPTRELPTVDGAS